MQTGITKGQVFRYVALPGIAPRLAQLFVTGFHYVPLFIALVYQAVRLLPEGHPYANPANVGRFGIRHVIGEAANHLIISRRNIDQLVLFVSILVGLVIVIVQLCLLAVGLLMPAAMAMPLTFDGFFITPPATEDTDLAHMLLDMVFGVPGIFNSCISTAALCQDLNGVPIGLFANPLAGFGLISPLAPTSFLFFPFAIHVGLHQMFQFYSLGLLIVAVIISSYFIITVIAETAETGTAFGKRFNKVWAPIRFAVAFGLLIPVGFGLNSSQYLVLYAAKFGSGFATNGWNLFNTVLVTNFNSAYLNNTLGNAFRLVSRPSTPEAAISDLIQFFFIARTCKHVEEMFLNARRLAPSPPAAAGTLLPPPADPQGRTPIEIRPYLVRGLGFFPPLPNNALEVTPATTYAAALSFADGASSLTLRFGIRKPPPTQPGPAGADDTHYGFEKGFVKPICGEIKFNLTDPRNPAVNNMGTQSLQEYYWFIVKELWNTDALTSLLGFPNYPLNYARTYSVTENIPVLPLPDEVYKTQARAAYAGDFTCALANICPGPLGPPPVLRPAILQQLGSVNWGVPVALRDKGWAGAGIWYNRVAEMNGSLTTAAYNIPIVSKYPFVMEYIKIKKSQYDQAVSMEEQYLPLLADGQDVPQQRPQDENISRTLYMAWKYWVSDGGISTSHTEPTGNIIIDTINQILGTDGLYSMRKNADIHPLAQLVGVGRALVESSIRNLAYAGIGKIFIGAVNKDMGSFFAGLFVTIAMIGLTAGFILFYVVPFLPFIYFFFAVGGWIKGIFEAMLGAPLWALAHIRIDGNGLPGQAAANGYFLIFEIFIRPILIIFGLVASISIFAALVDVLNSIFDMVTSNLTGFDVECELTGCGPTDIEFYRGPVDEFMFTVIYAILVYLIGLSSFKLIDLIPNNILRWMGASVATFNDQREDAVQGMLSTTTIGTQQALQQIGGGLQGLVGGKK